MGRACAAPGTRWAVSELGGRRELVGAVIGRSCTPAVPLGSGDVRAASGLWDALVLSSPSLASAPGPKLRPKKADLPLGLMEPWRSSKWPGSRRPPQVSAVEVPTIFFWGLHPVTFGPRPFLPDQRPGTAPRAAAAVALGLRSRRRGGASATTGPCSAGAGTGRWRRRGLPLAAPPFNQGYYQTGLAGWRRPALPPLAQGGVGVGSPSQLPHFWSIVTKGHT